jgi:hypothetical protein
MTDEIKDVRRLSAADYAAAKAAVTGQYVRPVSTGPDAMNMTPEQYRAAKAAIIRTSK